MKYLIWSLGYLSGKAVIQVALRGVSSDVFLADDANFRRFTRGESFNYYGGHYQGSPIRLSPPSSGHWNAVVVPKGGSVEASVQVLAA